MKKIICIGKHRFNYKKDALLHFKNTLNSYDYGEVLRGDDLEDVTSLLEQHEKLEEKIGLGIKDIKVDAVRYKTKCFHIIRVDSSTVVFSYTKCINGASSSTAKFSKACRELIGSDLREVKLSYFKGRSKKGRVKCQETGELCLWEELNVDHRQPNTFSVIVDRFIEVNNIDLSAIEYIEAIDSVYEFKNADISDAFKKYHKEKANLRIVKKDRNLGRSHQARIKRQKKDLIVN
ncbi:MAG: DCL family protein [Gammaproteobacteria bacterium]|nr:DCL family protein [Gammaproteobacteria bacterium]MCF6230124.1 DCL family protein [Gammaproteobacteria bacterium]